jgi:small subunit ribosomal protein S18
MMNDDKRSSEGADGRDRGYGRDAGGDGRGGKDGERGGRGGRRRFRGRGRRKVCRFCADKALPLDYKWTEILDEFISERGRFVPSRTTGTCARHQRRLKIAVKRARNVGLLPYSRV